MEAVMSRDELKSIIKECYIEIKNDNMSINEGVGNNIRTKIIRIIKWVLDKLEFLKTKVAEFISNIKDKIKKNKEKAITYAKAADAQKDYKLYKKEYEKYNKKAEDQLDRIYKLNDKITKAKTNMVDLKNQAADVLNSNSNDDINLLKWRSEKIYKEAERYEDLVNDLEKDYNMLREEYNKNINSARYALDTSNAAISKSTELYNKAGKM